MLELIEANEFGDWLLREIRKAEAQQRSANAELARFAASRLETLKAARKLLLEFLVIQQAMLDVADEFRSDQDAVWSDA